MDDQYNFFDAPRALVTLEDGREFVFVVLNKAITLDAEVKRLYPKAKRCQKITLKGHMAWRLAQGE